MKIAINVQHSNATSIVITIPTIISTLLAYNKETLNIHSQHLVAGFTACICKKK